MPDTKLDRREILKATGAAVGVAAIGATGRALASSTHSHVIAASDSHLGAPKANESAFLDFIQNDVPSKDPDALILNGDIIEFWTRGMSSACLDFNDFTTHLEDLDSSGIDVVITAGNHDRRLIDVGRSDYDAATLEAPWSVVNEFYFESGGTEFVATHGDSGDPLQTNQTSELLCLGSDDFGKVVWDFYSAKDDMGSADAGYIGEVGEFSSSTDEGDWEHVYFEQNYNDPVVFAGPLSYNGSDESHPRIRDVDSDDFEYQIEEWDYHDGDHISETVGYAALEKGVHTFPDGTVLEVGTVKTDDTWKEVSFSNDFDSTPTILTQSQTHNCGCLSGNSASIETRQSDADTEGFKVCVQEMEADDGNHTNEKVGYVAIEPRTGKNNGIPFEVGKTGDTVTDSWHTVGFDQSYGSEPLFLASIGTYDGADPVGLRHRNKDASGVDVFLEEEQSEDDETGHATENVHYLAAESPGRLYASHSTAFTDWWEHVTDDAWNVWDDVTSNVDVPTNDLILDNPPMMAGLEQEGQSGPGIVTKNLLDTYSEYVVFGHTHVPAKGDRYVNSGAWTSRSGANLSGGSSAENTYVEIKDGGVTVYDWSSSGSTVLF